MEEKILNKIRGRHFTAGDIGKIDEIGNYTFSHSKLPGPVCGKLFLKREMDLTGMEVSINKLEPGKKQPFAHSHRESEELYIFLKGKGEFHVDDEILEVKEGTVVRVAPEGVRTWLNNSDEDLYFICVQSKAGSMSKEAFFDGIPS